MRKSILARLIFSSTVASAAVLWIACSGSDKQDVIQTDSGADTGRGDDVDNEDSGGGSDSGGQSDTGVADTGADVKIYDAGAPIVLDAGDFEGGIPCVVGGELEEEPNDSTLLANELRPTRCGVIRVLADAGESDFLSFTLADASTSFYLQYAGEVNVLVETDGSAPVDISQGSPQLTFKKGQPYFVQVKSKTGKQQVWRVTLFQE